MESQEARQYFRDHAKKTTNLAAINSTILGMLPITLPPVDEQARIVSELDGVLTEIDRLTDECQALIALLKERRSALITAAVTGKIDVRDQAAS
jgi:restriction endonuclease S subunit